MQLGIYKLILKLLEQASCLQGRKAWNTACRFVYKKYMYIHLFKEGLR